MKKKTNIQLLLNVLFCFLLLSYTHTIVAQNQKANAKMLRSMPPTTTQSTSSEIVQKNLHEQRPKMQFKQERRIVRQFPHAQDNGIVQYPTDKYESMTTTEQKALKSKVETAGYQFQLVETEEKRKINQPISSKPKIAATNLPKASTQSTKAKKRVVKHLFPQSKKQLSKAHKNENGVSPKIQNLLDKKQAYIHSVNPDGTPKAIKLVTKERARSYPMPKAVNK